MRNTILLLLLLPWHAFAGEPVYTWRYRDDDPDRVYLYRDGKQIGGWCYRDKHYRSFYGDTWGSPVGTAPTPPPEKMSISTSTASYSPPPQRRLLRPIKSRVEAGVDAALSRYSEANAWRLVGEALRESFAREPLRFSFEGLYLIDLDYSAKLFAHLEMGGKLDDKPDSANAKLAKDLMANGSAHVFIAEKAKFVEKLRKEEFSELVLTTIRLDVADDDPSVSKAAGSQPDAELPSIRLPRARNWHDEPATAAPDAPFVLLTRSHRAKDAAEKIPVVVHCSFTYQAKKEGKALTKTLLFDLFLETLDSSGEGYPWKVRNVKYN